MTRLIPDRGWYSVDDEVVIELTDPSLEATELTVLHLDRVVRSVTVAPGATSVRVGTLERGGYGIRLGDAYTAVDVLAHAFERPRYGFVSTLAGDTDGQEFAKFARRLHLTASQFYDWAYRHSTLLPPTRHYVDPLGLERDLEVVNRVARALDAAGVTTMGYSAVYAVGHGEVDDWRDSLILRADGEPYRLGENFLVLVDPAEPRWLEYYLEQLASVVEHTNIRGFHLDQYGWPKFARRPDGARVDLAESYRVLLEAIRERLPETPFMFNNVNDFPTPVTTQTGQDATYVEVWDPHSELGDLAVIATNARHARPERPPILSAYLPCYANDEESRADTAAALVMATAFSHGANHLLLGEDGAALTGPYYPDHHRLSARSVEHFVSWYDFAVRYGDLLFDPAAIDVTESFTGGINEDVVFWGPDPGIRFSTKASAGTVWTRVVRTDRGFVIHVIDLRAQTETRWDSGKNPVEPLAGLVLQLAAVTPAAQVKVAQVSRPDLVTIGGSGVTRAEQSDALSAGQVQARFELPTLHTWGIILVPFEAF